MCVKKKVNCGESGRRIRKEKQDKTQCGGKERRVG